MAYASRKEARAATPRLGRAKRAVMAHSARNARCNGEFSDQAIVRSSRAGNGCSFNARAVVAGRADCLNSLAVGETSSSMKAFSTRGIAVSSRNRIIGSGRARHGRRHALAVAKAAGGARQRAHGCAAAIGAIAAHGARNACVFERRAGGEARGGIHVCAGRAAAVDASVDGVQVAVKGPNIHGAISAKHGR